MKPSFFPFFIVFLAAISLNACSNKTPPPAPSDPPALRLAVLSPALSIILTDLGAGDLIVGRHLYDQSLDQGLPIVGDQAGIDYEALLLTRPTHVLIEKGASDPPARLIELAKKRRWTIVRLPMLSLNEIRSAMQTLTKLLQTKAANDRLADLEHRFDLALQPDPELTNSAGRTLLLYWTNPPGAAGPGSFHHEILQSLSISPALVDGAPYQELSPETIRALDPDALILFVPGLPANEPIDKLLGPLADIGLRCLNEGRFGVISSKDCLLPSSSVIQTTTEIRNLIESWVGPTE